MATKKRMGRPKLTAAEKKERAKQKRISLKLSPFQLELVEAWMEKTDTLRNSPMKIEDAITHLVMSRLMHTYSDRRLMSKEEVREEGPSIY